MAFSVTLSPSSTISKKAKKPPKMTGLFAHLNTTDNEISAALDTAKLERESALNQSLDTL